MVALLFAGHSVARRPKAARRLAFSLPRWLFRPAIEGQPGLDAAARLELAALRPLPVTDACRWG